MVYLFELMAKRHRPSRMSKEPNVGSATIIETAEASFAFPMNTNGEVKNGPTRPGTLGHTNAKAEPAPKRRRNCCVSCCGVLIGMTLGSVLSEPKTETIQIASMD
jgi:hypothetical protein